MTNLSIDSHVRITAGIHQGQTARVIGEAPEGVRVAIDFFGREMEVVIEHAHLSPVTSRRAELRARVEQDCVGWKQQLDRQFWTARSELLDKDPISDLRAYAQHSERINADARQAKLLAEFDARFASVPEEQVDALFEAEAQRWLPYWNQCACRVLSPGNNELRAHNFIDAPPEISADEEVAFLRNALFATPIYLEDPPRDLNFDAANAPWTAVFATTGADIVQHTQHGTRRAPSESAFYTKIAALLVG